MKKLDPKETQVAIKELKDFFERELARELNLIRVSAPLFVTPESGLNDNLSGSEKAVSFKMGKYDQDIEIVQSLAKWKRYALKKYDFKVGEGIYTDMNAIRPDEILDATHSMYVDQWDWEKVISREDRTEEFLRDTVKRIYEAFKKSEKHINELYPEILSYKLPEEIKFFTTGELEGLYPDLSPEKREDEITKKYKAVFISKIGYELGNGQPHGSRSPDYDDWTLNGDIVFWNPILNSAFELSSMGIRVDEEALEKQLEHAKCTDRKCLDYHRRLLGGELPYTVGGGIGQSRICMYFLEKAHIGEVQASVWTEDIVRKSEEEGIFLL